MNLASLAFIGATHRRPRGSRIRLVVIHDAETPETKTSAEGVARYFASGNTTGSAHLCFDSDSGVRCAWDEERTNGAGGVNDIALHVELAGYASQSRGDWLDPYSRATLVNAAGCVREWCEIHGLPVRKLNGHEIVAGLGICGHDDVSQVYAASGGHYDPGGEFPWDVFIDMVAGAAAPSAEQTAAFWRLLAELGRVQRVRRVCAMWFLRDSRPEAKGATYLYDGQTARHLDATEFGIQTELMRQLGIPPKTYDDSQYMIDRLRAQGRLV